MVIMKMCVVEFNAVIDPTACKILLPEPNVMLWHQKSLLTKQNTY